MRAEPGTGPCVTHTTVVPALLLQQLQQRRSAGSLIGYLAARGIFDAADLTDRRRLQPKLGWLGRERGVRISVGLLWNHAPHFALALASATGRKRLRRCLSASL